MHGRKKNRNDNNVREKYVKPECYINIRKKIYWFFF